MGETSHNGLPYFDTEQEFQDYLESKFESVGFDVIQEVSPHNSQYRVDLLLLHDEYGPIGMELKRLTGGSDAGKAHQQIVRQYSGRRYIGKKVKNGYSHRISRNCNTIQILRIGQTIFKRKIRSLRTLFQAYGIGVLNVHSRPYSRIKWGHDNKHMLPGFSMARKRFEPDYNLDSIESRIAERLYEVDSYADI